jgi:hypothetical protein
VQVVDFTENVDDFVKFLKTVRAHGGGDFAEDLVTPIECAEKILTFNPAALLQTFVITDAPTHGKQYHEGVSDRFADNTPEYSLERAVQSLMKKGNPAMPNTLFCMRITKHTDKMY